MQANRFLAAVKEAERKEEKETVLSMTNFCILSLVDCCR